MNNSCKHLESAPAIALLVLFLPFVACAAETNWLGTLDDKCPGSRGVILMDFIDVAKCSLVVNANKTPHL